MSNLPPPGQQPPPPQTPPPQPQPGPAQPQPGTQHRGWAWDGTQWVPTSHPQAKRSTSTGGFICGLIGTGVGLIPLLFFISIPLGVAALVLGILGWRKTPRAKLARAATIFGATAIGLGIWGAVIVDEAVDDLDEAFDDFERAQEGIASNDVEDAIADPADLPGIGDTLQLDDGGSVLVHSVERPTDFLVADIEVCANEVNPLFWELVFESNRTSDSNLLAETFDDGRLSSGNFDTITCRRGLVEFDVPAGETPVALHRDVFGNEAIIAVDG